MLAAVGKPCMRSSAAPLCPTLLQPRFAACCQGTRPQLLEKQHNNSWGCSWHGAVVDVALRTHKQPSSTHPVEIGAAQPRKPQHGRQQPAGSSTPTHPVMPMCSPRSRHCCSSCPLPVKQCSMPGTPLAPKPVASRISANLVPASLQCMNRGLRSSSASLTCAANHCSCTSGGLKLRLKSSPHSPAAAMTVNGSSSRNSKYSKSRSDSNNSDALAASAVRRCQPHRQGGSSALPVGAERVVVCSEAVFGRRACCGHPSTSQKYQSKAGSNAA